MTAPLRFYVSSDSALARDVIRSRNYPVRMVQSDEEFIVAVRDNRITLVINDILDSSDRYVSQLRADGERVVVNIEDLGTGARRADLTINDLYEYSTPSENQLFGWRYACLRDEFLHASPSAFREQVESILITFGGTDPSDMTTRALRACAGTVGSRPIKITVVLGIGNPRSACIKDVARSLARESLSIEVHQDVRRMSVLMKQSDIAITSNGRTVFELASLGIPMITISQNPRETTHTFGRIAGGVIDLGLHSSVDDILLSSSIEKLISDMATRKEMRDSLLSYDLRHGVQRVVEAINSVYEKWRVSKGERYIWWN